MEYERASKLARRGELVEAQAREVLKDIMKRADMGETLQTVSIKSHFDNWLASKKDRKSEGTGERYGVAVEDFLKTLGKLPSPRAYVRLPDGDEVGACCEWRVKTYARGRNSGGATCAGMGIGTRACQNQPWPATAGNPPAKGKRKSLSASRATEPSVTNFAELLFGALRVPDVAHGFLVRPTLFPRFAQAARGRFARLNPPLREFRFHGFTFNFSAAASLR